MTKEKKATTKNKVSMFHKCLLCGKVRGYHQAKTLHCPVGAKSRLGWTTYHETNVFVPDPKKALTQPAVTI